MGRHGIYFAVLAGAVGLAAAFFLLRFGAAFALSVALALPSAETWLHPLAHEPVREEVTISAGGREFPADLYRPARPRGALLLVHGLSPAGRRHPELMRLARLLAQQGQVVMVPQFEGLSAFRLGGREIADVRAALHWLTERNGQVGIAGFSFGAGPALLAAADFPDLRVAGSFGGYADLRHVITYITTGVHSYGGRRHVQRFEEYNRWKLLALLAGFAENQQDRGLLEVIAARKLANPFDDTQGLEAGLGSEGRGVLALALNHREEAVDPLIAGLPRRAREALDRLSPLSVLPRIAGRLLIAHGAGDDSIPFTESLRLAEAAGKRARVTILGTFHHTGAQPFWQSLQRRILDGGELLFLTDELLAAR